jgi:ABC-type phosphate transport system substrate-binding protein
VALENTSCEAVPLENVSRLQVLLLFSGQIKNWNQFGPYFPDLPVVLCMRHGGSGTHATLENGVFRGDAVMVTNSVPVAPNYIWHHTSSTDLTDSCIEAYPGAVGYIDADKALGIDDTGHIHQMKYQGVEPTRGKIVNCEYNYWAAQNVFYDPDCVETAGDYPSAVRTQIVTDLIAYASDENNLTQALFGERAKFWATQGEMKCAKANDYAYPQVK